MAERYPLGKNRIFYRTTNFREGVTVTIDILTPSLHWIECCSLTESGKGLYFLDFDFSEEGTYGAVVYEDEKKVTTQAYLASDEPIGIKSDIKVLLDTKDRRGGDLGPGVINL